MAGGGIEVTSRSGARFPALGFGTGSVGEDCEKTVLAALEAGYRHIDTARKYGTERGVGAAIRASGLPRDDLFVTTKVSHEHLRADDFARSTEASLRDLQLDRVDLLLVHWPLPDMPFEETIGALAEMKRRGLTRHIGVANFNIDLLEKAIAASPEPLSALQAEYHPFLDQAKVLEFCRSRGLVFIAYCPLARGKVFGDAVLAEVAAERGRTVSQIVLRWLVQQEGVAAIPSSTNPERIRDNLGIFDFELSAAEMRRINGLARPDGRIVNPKGRAPVWDAAEQA